MPVISTTATISHWARYIEYSHMYVCILAITCKEDRVWHHISDCIIILLPILRSHTHPGLKTCQAVQVSVNTTLLAAVYSPFEFKYRIGCLLAIALATHKYA